MLFRSISASTRNPHSGRRYDRVIEEAPPSPGAIPGDDGLPTRKPAWLVTSTALQPEVGFPGRTSTSRPRCARPLFHMGIILIRKSIVVVSSRQHLKAARNRARRHATGQLPVWSPGVSVESRRPKIAPWRPPASKSPCAKSFVSGGRLCK